MFNEHLFSVSQALSLSHHLSSLHIRVVTLTLDNSNLNMWFKVNQQFLFTITKYVTLLSPNRIEELVKMVRLL